MPAARGDDRARSAARAGALRPRAQDGQALLLLVGALCAVLIGAFMLGAIARGIGAEGRDQRAADLAALAGARAMRAAYGGLFEPARVAGAANPGHVEHDEYLARGRAAARDTAAGNGASDVAVSFPHASDIAPTRIRVVVRDPARVTIAGHQRAAAVKASAEAELGVPAGAPPMSVGPGDYQGPLAYRQGKPMRPDVAVWFDRMNAAASAAGVPLVINSAFRSDAEQAILFAQHPDPKWVAPPGKSLHRLGTELDLGPASAYGWLSAHAGEFHFIQRYSWEPWHYGFTLNAGTTSVGYGGDGGGSTPSFVPAQYAPMIARAAQRWNVSGALLAAQLYAESNFNPFAVSSVGAQGIAQFMPGTGSAYGLDDPFDAAQSIDAEAHLMRDLLRQFGAVPLALAAYNAGPGPVRECGCVPAIPETQAYVAKILGLMSGAGDLTGATFTVRLVR